MPKGSVNSIVFLYCWFPVGKGFRAFSRLPKGAMAQKGKDLKVKGILT